MRRPPTYFAKVLNRLKPTYLPKTLKYIYNTGVMCRPGHISYNRSDRQVLKNSQGRPYEMSSNIFCKSCKQIKAYISPKNIELYTIQAVMCHPGHISHDRSDRRVLKKSQGRPYETSSNIFGKILNRLMSTYLPYTLNYIQYRLLCVTQATYREIKTLAKS